MKTLFAILLLCPLAVSQDASTATAAAPGCGKADAKFDVATRNEHPVEQPPAGKAMVYFIQDDAAFFSWPKPTTLIGLDGAWVGATRKDSYFYLPVEAGEHHLCATWQTAVVVGSGHPTAAAHFAAEAGQSYYFRARNITGKDRPTEIKFGPVDSDEAQLLMSKFSLSTSRPKK